MGKENLEHVVPRFFSSKERSPLEVDRQLKTHNHSTLRERFVLFPCGTSNLHQMCSIFVPPVDLGVEDGKRAI